MLFSFPEHTEQLKSLERNLKLIRIETKLIRYSSTMEEKYFWQI